ncbi:membrane bound O-acyl transferase family-domain-containing protein [Lentinula raphanica]|uniref:Membrane bound O-acyl transferase family-domain-containing protein n=1 Tax=Lentinula raphanica TaxID=153919 RepID=A0AA38NY08_9AGAR|nr:membrane bound O-acyl transferase family-domain-containing protein [Lentinula raphanica]
MASPSTQTPSFVMPLSFFIHALGVTSRSFNVRRSLFAVILSISYFTIFATSTEDPPLNYGYATAMGSLAFQALDFLVLNESSKFVLVAQHEHDDKSFVPRHLRAWQLILTPRGIGWAHEPKDILPPHPPPQPRHTFVLSQLCSAAVWLIIGDFVNLASRSHPGFQVDGSSIADVGPFMRILNVFLFAVPSVATLQIQYKMLCILTTTATLYRPQDCPELFGEWKEAYTIRRFWGRTWHQTMRRWVSAPGNFIAHDVLELKKGTKLSAYTKLIIAFLVSGTIHQMGDYALKHQSFFAGGSLSFFMLQAAAIMFEDSVIDIGSSLGICKGTYTWSLGYLWTLTWFALTLPIWLDPYFHNGMANVKFSLIGGIWKGDWTGSSVKLPLPLSY